jgi:hypothetical protein
MQKSKAVSQTNRRAWTALGILSGLLFMAIAADVNWQITPTSPESTAAEIVNRHLAWADSQGQVDVAASVTPIRELFAKARRGTRKFSEESFSLKSKFKLATDFVTNGSEHVAFLHERFAAHVFDPEALERVVQSAVASHVRHLDDIDSELLVRLRADLEGAPNLQLSAKIDRTAIQSSLDRSIRQAISAVEADLGPGVGLEIVSYLAGEVLATATFKLAASSGILGAGAASGTVSFGVGLIAGLIVDYIVSWVYDEVFDPIGELTKQLNATLDALEKLILAGDDKGPGLIQRLQAYGAQRSAARNAVIRELVVESAINSQSGY